MEWEIIIMELEKKEFHYFYQLKLDCGNLENFQFDFLVFPEFEKWLRQKETIETIQIIKDCPQIRSNFIVFQMSIIFSKNVCKYLN